MVQIVIPVAPISRKIIETEKGPPPIRLTSRDLLFDAMALEGKRNRGATKTLQTILTDQISFEVTVGKTRRLEKRSHIIGKHLYDVHLDAMCRFVLAQWNVGIDATRALENFYAQYDLEDDDYSYDSAYKRWQRFKWDIEAKKHTFFKKKTRQSVLRKSKQSAAGVQLNIPLSDQDEVDVHNSFMKAFYFKIHTAPETYLSFFIPWLRYYYMGLTIEETAEKTKMSSSTVHYQITTFNQFVELDDHFKSIVVDVLTEVIPHQAFRVLPKAS